MSCWSSSVAPQAHALRLADQVPLLPGAAVTLRRAAVIPRHRSSPLARVTSAAAVSCRCQLLPGAAFALGRSAVIPRHGCPPLLAETGRRAYSRRLIRCRALLIPRHGRPPRRLSNPCLAENCDLNGCRRCATSLVLALSGAKKLFTAVSLAFSYFCLLCLRTFVSSLTLVHL
jgi:hypothetical protein